MENARLFTLPSEPPLIYVSVFGTDATQLAARIGDGYINTSPNHEPLDHYTKSGGRGPMLPAGAGASAVGDSGHSPVPG